MRYTTNVIFSFLLCLLCLLHEGHTITAEQWEDNGTFLEGQVTKINPWKCSTTADCTVADSKCIDNTCQCPKGYIFNTDMTSCLKVATAYGDKCTETIQCSRYLLSGGTCVNDKCTCAEGYYYIHGRCNSYSGLFGKCRMDDDCYVNADFEATSCKDGSCACSSGFYQREYRTCRRAGNSVGEECTVDLDCIFSESAECTEWKCVDNTTSYISNHAEQKLNARDADVTDTGVRVGNKCTADADCEVLGNAVCSDLGTCICKRGHFVPPEKFKCHPELGEPCQSNDPSVIDDSVCRNGRWACIPRTVPSKDNRICRKTIRFYDGYCMFDEQCYIFGPDAYCENDKCTCKNKSHYVESEMFCWTSKGIGETCKSDVDCYLQETDTELLCANNVCSCPNGTRPNLEGTDCLNNWAELGDDCGSDTDCVVDNALCRNWTCVCANNYYELDGQCAPGIEAPCSSNDGCAPRNSECIESKCSCKEDHILASVDKCLPVVPYGEPCEENIQCSTVLPNTVCLEAESTTASGYSTAESTKMCTCMENYRYIFEKCFKKRVLGENCAYRGECFLNVDEDRVVCRNGKCSCDWDYVRVNETKCAINPNAKHYNHNSGTRSTLGGLLAILLGIINLLNLI